MSVMKCPWCDGPMKLKMRDKFKFTNVKISGSSKYARHMIDVSKARSRFKEENILLECRDCPYKESARVHKIVCDPITRCSECNKPLTMAGYMVTEFEVVKIDGENAIKVTPSMRETTSYLLCEQCAMFADESVKNRVEKGQQ